MDKKSSKPFVIFGICFFVALACAGMAWFVLTGFGNVTVTNGFFMPDPSLAANELPVRIAYRLYKPKSADADNPVPAVLAMHGYQNDKETNSAYCIELARRGIAVMSIDLYGHGDSSPGMRGRGWGRFKINNLDNEVSSGPRRFLLMMTFGVLDFFRPEISSGVVDSSMGGKSAWQYLKALPFVDSERMGLTGHSMGTWASWSVAAEFPEHKAIVLQCGELFPLDYYDSENIKFNNVLLLQARIEEFENMRDYGPNILGLENTPMRYRDFMGQAAPVEWNRTYGNFADGTARRMELIQNNHRLTTHDRHAIAAAMNWFITGLDASTDMADMDHVFIIKEALVLIAMLSAMVSMLPLFLILARLKFFTPLVRPLTVNVKTLSPKKRRTALLTAVLVSGLTYPFLTQLGHGLFPFPENIFRMTIGNGFIIWLTFLMLVSLLMMIRWYKKGEGKKAGWTTADLGLGECSPSPESADSGSKKGCACAGIIGRAVVMSLILTCTVYVLVCISTALFGLDFRFIWPFFRPFNPVRLGQFFLYLPFYVAFFTVNAGVRLYGQMRLPEFYPKSDPLKRKSSPVMTQLAWWGYSILVMLGGVILIALIQYVPFFMGFGPGADLLFSPMFGGPFMSILILLIPQFAVFFFFSTWFFRKSGTVYTGSFVVAIMAAWILAGGSAIF